MRPSLFRRCAWSSALALLAAVPGRGQSFTQRGFLETRFLAYPQTAPGDSGRAVGSALLRYEAAWKPWSGWRFAGDFDVRTDTHRQVERAWGLDWQDRGLQRPAFAVRRLSATWRRGPVTFELGKQFIRWGKTDLLNPTDRFAPRDYLEVVDNDFLGVTAARLTFEKGNDTVDLIWQPRFTPSRLPLFNQRWVVLPEAATRVVPPELPIRDAGAQYPARAHMGASQFGVRWNHVGAGYEYSLSCYDGFNHLPLVVPRLWLDPMRVELTRLYPSMRMYGADAAVPLKWLTLKAETAWFTTRTGAADEYVQYVLQVERQAGEWFLVAGYAGEAVTTAGSGLDFSPERGLARTVLVHAGYTLDANRSLALEAALRDNGDGVWARFSYSHALGQHWRATAAVSLIRGAATDFFGQYRRNSHASVTLRYSF